MPRSTAKPLPFDPDELVIGVDAGASEVRAQEVHVSQRGGKQSIDLGPASASACYDRVEGFEALAMAQQLVASERGELELEPLEKEQARVWIAATAGAIASVAEEAGQRRVRVGLCLPGVKTADGRGVALMRNGPRIPNYLDLLEALLMQRGLVLAAPIPALVSDGDAGAIGERLARGGQLAGLSNAYYLGGGTGLAEAFLLDGAVVGVGALRAWVRKAWRLTHACGASFEDLASARGLNERWAEQSGASFPLSDGEFPEQRALEGDARARELLREAALVLAELFFLRIDAFARAERLPRVRHAEKLPRSYVRLAPHTELERIVVGQRIGRMLAEPDLSPWLREPLEHGLAARIAATSDAWYAERYLDGTNLRAGFVSPSLLRAAPALGAAAHALSTARAAARAATHSALEIKPETRGLASEERGG